MHSVLSVLAELALSIQLPKHLHLTVFPVPQCLVGDSVQAGSTYIPAPHHPAVPGGCCEYKQVQRTFHPTLHLTILQCPVGAVSTSRSNLHSHTSCISPSCSARQEHKQVQRTFHPTLHLTTLQCPVGAVSTSRYNVHSTLPCTHRLPVPGGCCQNK